MRLAIACFAAIGVGLGAVAACIWRPDVLAALTLIPAWCWLLAGLISTAPAWRTRKRRMACALTILWFVFAIGWVEELNSLVRGFVVKVRSTTIPAGRPLRIVSLNCDGNLRCLSDLQRVNPDVLLIQEAPGKEGLANMSTQLFGDAGSSLAGGDTAIVSRGRIQPQFADRSAHYLAGTVVFEDGRSLECVSLRLAPPPSRLDFWSAGFWAGHRDMRHLHRRQLRQVSVQVTGKPASPALLVAGDFNTTPLDRALDELQPYLADAFDRKGLGWGATGTNDWPLFRVDQIWTNSGLTVVRVAAEKTRYSDHRMVVCDAVLQD